jgi:IS30 family transposase
MKKAPKLSSAERSELQILHARGYSARSIASVLGRSPNTIAAELKRNSYGDGKYVAARAKQKAYVRRKYARYQGKKIQETAQLREYITAGLQAGWNPDEISGAMRREEQPFYASKTAIYEWLYSAWGQAYCQYLPSRRYRPKKRRARRAPQNHIPARVSIAERPVAAQDRREPGHWEYDSVVSSKRSGSTSALAVACERSTRLVTATLVPNLRPAPFAETIAHQLRRAHVATLTTDNGIENRHHAVVSKKTGAPVFFTDPYSSWQKGGVENANKMLRRYFPKGTDFSTVKQADVVNALTRINNKPRKILGYKSSLEVASEKGVLLDAVS